MADIYQNYCSSYLIAVFYDYTIWIKHEISSLILLRWISWLSNPLTGFPTNLLSLSFQNQHPNPWQNINTTLFFVVIFPPPVTITLPTPISMPILIVFIIVQTLIPLPRVPIVLVRPLALGFKTYHFSIKILYLFLKV